jgi:hypothetical protein
MGPQSMPLWTGVVLIKRCLLILYVGCDFGDLRLFSPTISKEAINAVSLL